MSLREDDDPRLVRIERKLDSLGDAMISLARVEQKLLNSESDRLETHEILKEHGTELKNLKIRGDATASTVKFATTLFWIIITAAVTLGLGASLAPYIHTSPEEIIDGNQQN